MGELSAIHAARVAISKRVVRHDQAARRVMWVEMKEKLSRGPDWKSGSEAHFRAAEAWRCALAAIDHAVLVEESNGITRTGEGG